MTGTTSTDRTQRITMNGRTYVFVNSRHPEMDGHDNLCIGHLLNSQMRGAGYVFVMVRNGARILQGGPSGINSVAERAGLLQIVFSGPLQAMIDSKRTHLLATEALRAAGVPFVDNGHTASIRILLPGWGNVAVGDVYSVITGRLSSNLLAAMVQARMTETSERTRDQVRADWARIARQAVSYSDDLTTTERATLHEAAEILKGRPDILAQWIEAAQAEGAILGPSKDAMRA